MPNTLDPLQLQIAQLAAAVAAGVEANPAHGGWSPNQVADRAMRVAAEIVAIVLRDIDTSSNGDAQ
jgi:hypothetical protein